MFGRGDFTCVTIYSVTQFHNYFIIEEVVDLVILPTIARGTSASTKTKVSFSLSHSPPQSTMSTVKKDETASHSSDSDFSEQPNTLAIPSGDSSSNGQHGMAKNGGFYLRWSRLRKTVDVHDTSGGGLIRGSIAASSSTGLTKRGSISRTFMPGENCKETKDILCHVSGYAAPGELLACMGVSVNNVVLCVGRMVACS